MTANTINNLERRFFLRGAALTGLGLGLVACGDDDKNDVDGDDVDDAAVVAKELAQLNALLTAEYKAIDAYTQGAAVLTAERDDTSNSDEERGLAGLVLAVALEFVNDHSAHAALLDKTISDLDGTPVQSGTPATSFTLPADFTPTTVNVMKLAANEERRAAIAYNGVIKALSRSKNRYISAAIEGDETQHFMVLAALIDGLAVPTPALTEDTAGQVVPRSFVRTTEEFGGGAGLEAEANLATNDNA